MNTQYLKPDTSLYYNKDDYDEQMTTSLAKYADKQTIAVTDENYLELMELIYTYPSEFIGKKSAMTVLFIMQRKMIVMKSFCFVLGSFTV